MPNQWNVLNLSKVGLQASQPGILIHTEPTQFLRHAKPREWANLVMCEPSTEDDVHAVAEIAEELSRLGIQAAVIVDASQPSTYTSLCLSDLSLAAARHPAEFEGMTLVAAPTRIVALLRPDEVHEIRTKIESGELEHFAVGVWLQTHLDITSWHREDAFFEYHRWSRGVLAQRGDTQLFLDGSQVSNFSWLPGIHVFDGGYYRMKPLSVVLRQLPALHGEHLRSGAFALPVAPEVLALCLCAVVILLVQDRQRRNQSEVLEQLRQAATSSGQRLLRSVYDICIADGWRELSHAQVAGLEIIASLLDTVAHATEAFDPRMPEGQQSLIDLRIAVERIGQLYLTPGHDEDEPCFGRTLLEALRALNKFADVVSDPDFGPGFG